MTEFEIVKFLNHLLYGTFIDQISNFISLIPFLIVLFTILSFGALIFDKKNGKWVFLGSIIIVIVYFVLNDFIIKQNILVHIFTRERPYLAYPDSIFSLGEKWHDSSFPSGHMAMVGAFVTFYLFYYRKMWTVTIGLFFVLLMAFARMHNGMHYPTDVLAGSILGIGYGGLSFIIVKKISNSKKIPAIISGVKGDL